MGYDWQFADIVQYWPIFVRGGIVTVELTVGALVLALVIGLPLVQIVWIFYCFPILTGYQLNGVTTMIVALGIHSGAYVAEIVRAGINSIDHGQSAAAYAIGMSYGQALRRIVLPQALRRMIPPFVNEFANLIKLTTLGSTIAVSELLHESDIFFFYF